jgi:hypothetical protein
MRLQHSRSHALYCALLQAATGLLMVSGFRNATQQLRLANSISATIGADGKSVGMDESWDYQGADEHQSCCDDE